MKKRTIAYIKKMRARKIVQRPLETDLMTFLDATFQLCKSRVVKRHIKESISSLGNSAWYRLSA